MEMKGQLEIRCFRPLSGSSISQLIYSVTEETISDVFVPSRGHLYLNSVFYNVYICGYSFRPLSGSSISQSYIAHMDGEAYPVFVPSRGHLYLNTMSLERGA